MLKRMKKLLQQHKELILYIVFGALTTAVNYVVYLPLYNLLHLSAAVSNGIAWAAAVLFAYISNKLFVFQSRGWSLETILPELGKFTLCRVGSGVVETLIIYITVDCMDMNGNLMKLLTSILVVILNYIASKLFVFKRK